jgi:hypothetical protein
MTSKLTAKRTGLANKGIQKARKEKLHQESLQRLDAYSKLTNKEKIALLDAKFGQGLGAKKQRAKLN